MARYNEPGFIFTCNGLYFEHAVIPVIVVVDDSRGDCRPVDRGTGCDSMTLALHVRQRVLIGPHIAIEDEKIPHDHYDTFFRGHRDRLTSPCMPGRLKQPDAVRKFDITIDFDQFSPTQSGDQTEIVVLSYSLDGKGVQEIRPFIPLHDDSCIFEQIMARCVVIVQVCIDDRADIGRLEVFLIQGL